jgi:hypothetical protein
MRAYGNNREDQPMDRKRRYANCAPRAGDLAEERAAKRKTRAEAAAEIREAVAGIGNSVSLEATLDAEMPC